MYEKGGLGKEDCNKKNASYLFRLKSIHGALLFIGLKEGLTH